MNIKDMTIQINMHSNWRMISMFKLQVKLDKISIKLSRTVIVPENINFNDLDCVLRRVFNFSYFHISIFKFPGLNTPVWDFDKAFPDCAAMDMKDICIRDYLMLFKKFTWTYDLNNSYEFTITIRKANKKYTFDYPFVESFECDYQLIGDCHVYDFDEMLYCTVNGHEMPDYLPDFEMEKFNLDEINEKLK